jgi:hypothetical protein
LPSYNASPFAAPPQKLIPGQVAYLFGKWLQDTGPSLFAVTAVASTSTVLTFYVTLNAGNLPVSPYGVFTAYGLATDSQFNVTNATITAVSLNANGVGTITVTSTGYNVYSKTADGGVASVPQPEVGDAVANGQSVAVGLPYAVPQDSGQGVDALQCEVNFPIIPTACVVALQVALTNNAQTQWQTAISNVVTVAGGTATYGTTQWSGKANFGRYSLSGVTNSNSATIVAKLGI